MRPKSVPYAKRTLESIYFSEVMLIPLLTAEKEQLLGQKIQKGLDALRELSLFQKHLIRKKEKSKEEDDLASLLSPFLQEYDSKTKHNHDSNGEGSLVVFSLLPKELRLNGSNGFNKTDTIKISLLEDVVLEGREAFRQLCESNLGLVAEIARKYPPWKLSYMDMIQEGNIGLMKAAEKFEPWRNCRFSTYATWGIRQSIRRARQDYDRTVRVPVHILDKRPVILHCTSEFILEQGRPPFEEELIEKVKEAVKDERPKVTDKTIRAAISSFRSELSIDSIFQDEDRDPYECVHFLSIPSCQEQKTEHIELKQIINKEYLSVLLPKYRKVMELRYGLNGNNDHTLEAVGKIMGLTRERVRQIEAKSLFLIKRHTKKMQYWQQNKERIEPVQYTPQEIENVQSETSIPDTPTNSLEATIESTQSDVSQVNYSMQEQTIEAGQDPKRDYSKKGHKRRMDIRTLRKSVLGDPKIQAGLKGVARLINETHYVRDSRREAILDKAISSLTNEERDVLELKYKTENNDPAINYGYTPLRDIGRILGISYNKAGTLHRAALEKIVGSLNKR